VNKIEKVWQETNPQLTQLKDELDVLEDRLSRLIAKNQPEQQVLLRANEVESKRSALNVTRTMMLYHMRMTMQPTQRGKFEELHQNWQDEVYSPCQEQLEREQRDQRLKRDKAGPDAKSAPDPRKPSHL
jgi:hypothetical protein